MKSQKELVIFQIRVKRCTELSDSLRRELVFLELLAATKEKVKGQKTKLQNLWKTPVVEVTQRRTAGFGKPLYPMFLLSRQVTPPTEETPARPLFLIFKLKQNAKKKPKTIIAWKFDVMKFYGNTENANTVLVSTEHGPQIILNVLDITKLKKEQGEPILQREPSKKKSQIASPGRLARKISKSFIEKVPKKDVHGLPKNEEKEKAENEALNEIHEGIEEIDTIQVENEMEQITESETETDVSIAENKMIKEDASEMPDEIDFDIDLDSVVNIDDDPMDNDQPLPEDELRVSSLFSLDSVVNFDKEHDLMYKVIVIGDSGVGKSSVLGRWIREDFHLNIPSTVHVELSAKSFKVEDKIIKVQFWDTAGQERFNAITRQFYRGSHGAVILYDITCRKSFEDVAKWLQDVREVNSDTVILMVGNKCDLVKQRTVKVTEAIDYSKEVGVAFLETSAFTGDNCIKAMQLILQDIHSRNSIPTSLSSHDKKPLLTPSKVLIIDDPEPQPQPQTLHLTASTPKTTNTRKKDDCAC